MEWQTNSLKRKRKFAALAAVYGRKGGSVSSDKKKAATTESLKKARHARLLNMAEKGCLYRVQTPQSPTHFVGGIQACKRECRKLSHAEIFKATLQDLGR